jgi:PAS domain S-box-containing protein
MNLVNFDSANIPTQLWLASRYMQSSAFLIAPIFLQKSARLSIASYGILFILLIISIFSGFFPNAFIDGAGLTPFKIWSEYAICAILAAAVFSHARFAGKLEKNVLKIIVLSIIFSVFSDFAFTLYSTPFGLINVIGHLFKIVAFFLFYKAVIVTSLQSPQAILYRNLKKSEADLKESEAKYRALIESSMDCIKVFDRAGKLKFINNAGLKEHFLSNMEEAFEWDYFSCMSPNSVKRFKSALEEALAGKISIFEIEHIHGTADRDACMETVIPLANLKGETKNIICISRDITAERHATQAKNEFISLASHQLRTPLSSIGLTIDALLKGYVGDLNDKQKSYLQDAGKDAEFMNNLISRLLNLSRIEAGTFTDKPERIETRKFLDEIAGGFSVIAAKSNVEMRTDYSVDLLHAIKVDPSIMKNILQNLLSNAIRHTPPGGIITIKASSENQDILIGINDTGPGISKEMQPKIFSKLYKSSDLSEEGDKISSGLGLYIAKLFTESIGGRIWFETAEGKGTTFYVSLPKDAKKE